MDSSFSFGITGFKSADEKWLQMKSVWDACKSAGLDIPSKVLDFFGGDYPGDSPGMDLNIDSAAREFINHRGVAGIEIDVKKLPQDCTYIRVLERN